MKRLMLGLGLLLLAGCGPRAGGSTTPRQRSVEMPAENFVVATQARTLQLTLEGLELAALALRPDRTGSGLHIAPQWPLPRGKAADVAALRLGFQQAKAKARTAAAEWLARALLDEAAKLDAAETPWPAAQNLRIEASKVLTEVGADAPGAAETTTAMLASALFDIGDGQAAADLYERLLAGNPKSSHHDDYQLQLAWIVMAQGHSGWRQAAAATRALADAGNSEALYFRAWGLAAEADYGGAAQTLVAAARGRRDPALMKELSQLLAWSDLPVSQQLAALRGLDAAGTEASLQHTLELCDALTETGKRAAAAECLQELLAQPALAPGVQAHAHEGRLAEALAARRFDDLTTRVAALLAAADGWGDPALQQRAATTVLTYARVLRHEAERTHEAAVEDAVRAAYRGLVQHPQLAPGADASAELAAFEAATAGKAPPEAPEDDRALARRIADQHALELRHCYQRVLAREGQGRAAGHLKLELEATASGATRAVTASNDDVVELPDSLRACVKASVEGWRFPPHPSHVTIRLTLRVGFAFTGLTW